VCTFIGALLRKATLRLQNIFSVGLIEGLRFFQNDCAATSLPDFPRSKPVAVPFVYRCLRSESVNPLQAGRRAKREEQLAAKLRAQEALDEVRREVETEKERYAFER
jgi:hypothetical protein